AQAQQYERQHPRREPQEMGRAQAIAHAACGLARDLDARAVVVFTRTGRSAQLVSQDRPPVPVYAFTEQTSIARRLALWWGVEPRVVTFPDTTDEAIMMAERRLLGHEGLERGDRIVVVGSTPAVARARTNFLSVHRLGRRWDTPDMWEDANT
ncbi:MAG: hypothetical protein HY681_03630, partial [Chloroflexi bacterium]|nr:hypothetical protein [Chloroflexota bacterium]